MNQPETQFHTLVEALRHRSQHQADQCAYRFLSDGRTVSASLTYGQFDERARCIAASLQEVAAPGERVLLLYHQGLDYIAAFMGCLYAGVIAVPTYPPKRNRPDARLASIVGDCAPVALLTNSQILADLDLRIENAPQLKNVPWFNTDELDASASQWREQTTDDNAIAFLQYTSGSTSSPKGVMVSHRNLVHNLIDLDVSWKHDDSSVMVSWLPLFHDMGLIYGALEPLFMGFDCYLMTPASFLQSPVCWLEAISQFGGTHSAAPNFAFDLCTQSIAVEKYASLNLRSWRMALNAAEPVRDETIRRFQQKFASCGLRPNVVIPGFGLAENTLKVTATHVGDEYHVCHLNSEALGEHRIELASEPGVGVQSFVSCGPINDAAQICIVNPETRIQCMPDQVGEIWTAGESKACGYWGRGQATEETFAAKIQDAPEGTYLRTGDLGFIRDGQLYVAGRLKDLLIIRGLNHYPQDIEKTVEECHAALRPNCGAAFSVEVDGEEQLVIAQEVERIHRRNANSDEVIAAIRKALAESHDLQAYAVLLLRTATIPKTSSGKIQRHGCKQRFLDGSLHTVAEWRRQASSSDLNEQPPAQSKEEIQGWLVRTISGRTGVDAKQIRITEPFSAYGLDSAAAAAISGALQEWLKKDIAPTLLYDYPTIERLSAALTSAGGDAIQVATQSSRPDENEAIAIIGMACRFPGAKNSEEFWQLLVDGKSAVREVSPERWKHFDREEHPAAKWGGFIDGVDQFDPAFFEITPREAESMDPQQRLLLEVAWEALEDAQYAGGVPQDTGVFVGVSANDYAQVHQAAKAPANLYYGTGTAFSIAANRISYWLDARGPSMAIDTACSSSLVAVHEARQSLLRNECSLALAGGVNLMLTPLLSQAFASGQMLSPGGRCKTFDAAANGYVRGEGCGVVALKRLSDAQRDGDHILAVVRGSAVNQDGRSNGLTAPNGPSQRDVILGALNEAKLAPGDIQYIEAHGTGTPLGDPIECNTLREVFSTEGRSGTCWVGSVKTNIGHLESAAGIAGLIKTVLALQHKIIPAHLHFEQINPLIQFENSSMKVADQNVEWASSRGTCNAGVSSFGFGGTNSHIVLSSASDSLSECSQRSHHLLVLSAKSKFALQESAQRYVAYLDANPGAELADVCGGANIGRAHFSHRYAALASSRDELREALLNCECSEIKTDAPRIAFIFTGQGSQFHGMGRNLFETNETFRQTLERCDEVLRPSLNESLIDCLYKNGAERIHQTGFSQPALFALAYGLCEVWKSWGVEPCAVLGHSVGEYAAACAAGVMAWDDGLRLIAERGRLMQALPSGGGMTALLAPIAQAEELVAHYDGRLSLAALNGPRNTVVSGPVKLLEDLEQRAESQGTAARRLQTSHAFHSVLMEPMLDEFEAFASTIEFHAPDCTLISNLSGREEQTIDAAYWRRHVREPVRFSDGVQRLCELGVDAVIEIGPQPVLSGMARHCVTHDGAEWLPSLRKGEADWKTMLQGVGRLYARGASIHWRNVDSRYMQRKLSLPTYPFQRQRYWIEDGNEDLPSSLHANHNAIERLLASGEFDEDEKRLLPKMLEALRRLSQPQKENLYEIAWREQPLPDGLRQFDSAGAWLLLGDAGGVGDAIAQRLRAFGCHVVALASDGDLEAGFDQLQQCHAPLQSVLYLCALDSQPDGASTDEALCGSMMRLLQILAKRSDATPTKIWAATRCASVLPDDDGPIAFAQAPLHGFCKAAALEHPELWGGLVDLGSHSDELQLDALLNELAGEKNETAVALRGTRRYVARLMKSKNNIKREVAIRPDATYWIVGGLGALGLSAAQWLVGRGARTLVLSNRSAAAESVNAKLEALRAQGATLHVWRGDVCDANAMQELAQRIQRELPPLKGVIHAAGHLDDATIQNLDSKKLVNVMRPKTLGAINLYGAVEECKCDFILFYSSIAPLLGSAGQSNYCAANAFLDAFAHDLRRRGVDAFSVNWGPWRDGGMASQLDHQYKERLAVNGFQAMETDEALANLPRILNGAAPQIACLNVDWETAASRFPSKGVQAFLSELTAVSTTTSLRQELALLSQKQRKIRMLDAIQAIVMKIIGAKDRDAVSCSKGFFEMGMDSLMAVDLKNQLQTQFELALPSTIGFEYPTIEALADYLIEQCFAGDTAAAQHANMAGRKTVEEMSEQELVALIENEFEQWRT
ncbi:MAG: SDR family NAD(P)-dependent oxidoreductase [Candidatus Hinthialibacter antarcticus]|nr:SDR family NAD(P)-dependent oxidoreductase [Candidatus Hinthialibacter antarcticus]